MRMMAEKVLLAALGVALALHAHDPVGASLVIALLVAVSMTSFVVWAPSVRLSWLSAGVFVAIAAFVPLWRVFLPLAAYDQAGMALPGVQRREDGHAVFRPIMLLRGLWLLPLPLMAASDDPAHAMLLVTASCVGYVLGCESQKTRSLLRETRRMRDASRERDRATRRRMADVAQERAQSVRMATLGERTRIAREIHDNVGHLLTRAIMQAQASRAVAEATGDDEAARGFGSLGATLDDAMTMVRRSVHDLEDDGTDFAAQITDAARSFDGVAPGFHVSLTNTIADAPAPVARCFATAIREALSNVVHHSDARQASIMLRDMPALWQLVVEDPGPAVDAVPPPGVSPERSRRHERPGTPAGGRAGAGGDGEQGRGMGLADIEARARALGGAALCGPYAGGWRVFVSLPKSRWATREGDMS